MPLQCYRTLHVDGQSHLKKVGQLKKVVHTAELESPENINTPSRQSHTGAEIKKKWFDMKLDTKKLK